MSLKHKIKTTKIGNYIRKRRRYKNDFPDEKFLVYPKKTYIESLDVVLTTRCTLRCRDCCNLMPAYKNPKDQDLKDILASMRAIDKAVDQYGKYVLIGGETFLYPYLSEVLDAVPYDKAKEVIIYSNATVIPDETTLKKIQEKDITVAVALYDVALEKQAKCIKTMRKFGIKVKASYNENWRKESWLDGKNETLKDVDKHALRCFNNCTTLLEGKVYRCERQAHYDALGFCSSNTVRGEEYTADVFSDSTEKLKDKLKNIEWKREGLEACKHCSVGTNLCVKIEKAIQLKPNEPFPHQPKEYQNEGFKRNHKIN